MAALASLAYLVLPALALCLRFSPPEAAAAGGDQHPRQKPRPAYLFAAAVVVAATALAALLLTRGERHFSGEHDFFFAVAQDCWAAGPCPAVGQATMTARLGPLFYQLLTTLRALSPSPEAAFALIGLGHVAAAVLTFVLGARLFGLAAGLFAGVLLGVATPLLAVDLEPTHAALALWPMTGFAFALVAWARGALRAPFLALGAWALASQLHGLAVPSLALCAIPLLRRRLRGGRWLLAGLAVAALLYAPWIAHQLSTGGAELFEPNRGVVNTRFWPDVWDGIARLPSILWRPGEVLGDALLPATGGEPALAVFVALGILVFLWGVIRPKALSEHRATDALLFAFAAGPALLAAVLHRRWQSHYGFVFFPGAALAAAAGIRLFAGLPARLPSRWASERARGVLTFAVGGLAVLGLGAGRALAPSYVALAKPGPTYAFQREVAAALRAHGLAADEGLRARIHGEAWRRDEVGSRELGRLGGGGVDGTTHVLLVERCRRVSEAFARWQQTRSVGAHTMVIVGFAPDLVLSRFELMSVDAAISGIDWQRAPGEALSPGYFLAHRMEPWRGRLEQAGLPPVRARFTFERAATADERLVVVAAPPHATVKVSAGSVSASLVGEASASASTGAMARWRWRIPSGTAGAQRVTAEVEVSSASLRELDFYSEPERPCVEPASGR